MKLLLLQCLLATKQIFCCPCGLFQSIYQEQHLTSATPDHGILVGCFDQGGYHMHTDNKGSRDCRGALATSMNLHGLKSEEKIGFFKHLNPNCSNFKLAITTLYLSWMQDSSWWSRLDSRAAASRPFELHHTLEDSSERIMFLHRVPHDTITFDNYILYLIVQLGICLKLQY